MMRALAPALALGLALALSPPADAALPQQSGTVDLLAQANVQFDGSAAGDEAGGAVSGAGDVNGDGIGDVIVGAPFDSHNGRNDSGSAYVLFGRPAPTSLDLAAPGGRGFRIDGAASGDRAAFALAGAGDVNGDGLADVVVGASEADNNGRKTSGSAYVVFGKTSTTPVDLATLGAGGFRIDGAAAGDIAGVTVGDAGDVNGDGRPDVILGAPETAHNGTGSGSAYVVFGKASTQSVDLGSLGSGGFRMDGAAASDAAGQSVDGVGDMNGDGLDDVIVGAWEADDNSRTNAGTSYVVFGRASTATVPLGSLGPGGFRIDGAAASDLTGVVAAGAGDVNADDRPDVLVVGLGADNNGRAQSGSAWVVFGKATTTAVDLAGLGAGGFRIDGAASNDRLGSGAGVGDVNGDGAADVAVGTSSADNNVRTDSGSVYVVFGRASTATVDLAAAGAAGFRIDGAATGDRLASVAGAGDVNGDFRPDVLVGATGAHNNGRNISGSAYLVFGFGSPGLAYPGSIETAVGRPLAAVTPSVARTGPASFSVSPPLPAGLALDPATGVVSGTPTAAEATTAHTVTMTDLAGTARASVQVTVAGAGRPGDGPVADTIAPVLSGFAASPEAFAVAPGATPVAAKARRGTTFRFGLSETATTAITIERPSPGRRSGSKCVKPTRRNAKKRNCTRFTKLDTLERTGEPAGKDGINFTGRIGRSALRSGRYRATILATDTTGNKSTARTANFKVVKR